MIELNVTLSRGFWNNLVFMILLLIESCNASLVPPFFILINGSLMDFSMFKDAEDDLLFLYLFILGKIKTNSLGGNLKFFLGLIKQL